MPGLQQQEIVTIFFSLIMEMIFNNRKEGGSNAGI
jgi:hypothetical protein